MKKRDPCNTMPSMFKDTNLERCAIQYLIVKYSMKESMGLFLEGHAKIVSLIAGALILKLRTISFKLFLMCLAENSNIYLRLFTEHRLPRNQYCCNPNFIAQEA